MIDKSQFVSPPARWNAPQSPDQAALPPALFARFGFLALLLLAGIRPAFGQALPAAEAAPISTGFALPHAAGTLNYSLGASESLSWGYFGNQGVAASTGLNGDIGYISNSKLHPFSMVFSGGHSWSSGSQPSFSYLNLGLSQVANVKRWNFLISDSVGYLPATPSGGLSGVPGVGDLGLSTVPVGADTGQGVLTAYSDRVSNSVSGTVQRQITGKTTVNGFGSYGLMRFIGGGNHGLDSNSTGGGGGLNHEIDARTSVGGNYSYSTYDYPTGGVGVYQPGFTSQTAALQFSRQLSRKLGLNVSAGPQWSRVDIPGSPQALSAYVSVGFSYSGQFSHTSLSYVRSTNDGFGVVGGSLSDSVSFGINHTFARVWSCSATSSYAQSSTVPSANTAPFTFRTIVASAQVSRAIARSLSAYGSYTLEHQSSQGAAAVDVFSGLEQVAAFGVTYSPGSIHVGRQ